jgi:hypothetical protein
MGAHTCNISTQEAKAGELWVQGHPELRSKTLFSLPAKVKIVKMIIFMLHIFCNNSKIASQL